MFIVADLVSLTVSFYMDNTVNSAFWDFVHDIFIVHWFTSKLTYLNNSFRNT